MKKKCKQLLSILFLSLLVTLTFPTTAFAAKPTPGKVQLNKISAPAYNKINISWKKAKNATHYKIYYKNPELPNGTIFIQSELPKAVTPIHQTKNPLLR